MPKCAPAFLCFVPFQLRAVVSLPQIHVLQPQLPAPRRMTGSEVWACKAVELTKAAQVGPDPVWLGSSEDKTI